MLFFSSSSISPINMLLNVLLCLCCFACAVSGVPVEWTMLTATSTTPPARWNAGIAFITDSNIGYLFGGEGTTARGILGDTWQFTVTGGTVSWSELSATGPSARYGFVGGMIDNRYWVISHGCDNTTCFNDAWVLDTMSNTWSLLVNSSASQVMIPSPRTTTAGGVYPGQNELWLSMGENKAQFKRKFSDTWILRVNTTVSPISAMWEEVSAGGGLDQYNPFIPQARSLHAGAPLSPDVFVIFGGCAGGGQVGGRCPVDDAWYISLTGSANRTWQEYAHCPAGRTRSLLVPIPGSSGNGYLLGGSESYGPGVFSQQLVTSEVNNTEVYLLTMSDTTNNSWSRITISSATPPENLENPSFASDSNTVYYFGGKRLGDGGAFQNALWQLTGDGDGEVELECPAPQYTYVHLHGTLMYAAWGLFFPLGVLLGRYYRWTWPCWFVFHVILQCLGVLVTVAGFVVIFLVGTYYEPVFPHAIVGVVLTALMIQQFLSGIFHPCVDKENGKTLPEDKSTYRKCWEVYHAVSGILCVAIGLGEVTLGVFLVNSPLIVWAVWAGVGGLWLIVFFLHEFVYVCFKICHRGQKVY